jgi:hypothetical protein
LPSTSWSGPRARILLRPEHLRLDLPDLHATVQPDAAVVDAQGHPVLLVLWTPDDPDGPGDKHWSASPQQRFERLLLAHGPVGVHVFPDGIRLVYAPVGEASGHLTFPVEALLPADGRDLVDALVMLLGRARLVGDAERRLPALLAKSRSRQAEVTTALSAQVQDAMHTLVAGFNAANDRLDGRLFQGEDPAEIYRAQVTMLLRLLFLLFAEDRGMMSDVPLYEHYSVTRLAEDLRRDRLSHPQAMDRRFGAWARLLAVSHMVYRGAPALGIPARRGDLFDPDRHPLLLGHARHMHDPVPPVDDHTIERVLAALTHLEGQRLSYEHLSEEQLGSMYEAVMGFELKHAESPAIALRPTGAFVELEATLADPIGTVSAATGLKAPDLAKRAPDLAKASDIETLRTALAPLRTDRPEVPTGHYYLQPGEERRKSGSHYTPADLTRRIVEKTLAPWLPPPGVPLGPRAPSPASASRAGEGARGPSKAQTNPADLLALRICDPAMGTGAFLVQTVRLLGAALADAWARTGTTPPEAGNRADLYARRQVAEQCIYGVDKNPIAVQLAKLSLWLVTLERDLPFTFMDHALREGDALVGLTREEIANWRLPVGEGEALPMLAAPGIPELGGPATLRGQALTFVRDYGDKARMVQQADSQLEPLKLKGDLLLAVAEGGSFNKKEIKAGIDQLKAAGLLSRTSATSQKYLKSLHERPLHWQLTFPEVFARPDGGFDAVVGNPPFAGKNTILSASGDHYISLLQTLRPHSHGNADLSAHFFLRAAEILRPGGRFGLVATNTISQGDTRDTGLRWLLKRGVGLLDAEVDVPWPVSGGAAVIVNIVYGVRGQGGRLNSALKAEPEWDEPKALKENEGRCFQGSIVLGMGFTLVPAEAEALMAADERNCMIIKPYIGGQELNSNPTLSHQRYVIDFGDRTEEKAKEWPLLYAIAEERVKPQREQDKREIRRKKWWQFAERAPALYSAISSLDRCLVSARVSKHLLFAFQPTNIVLSDRLVGVALDDWFSFATLQSRVHEAWARGADLASTLKTDPLYTPSTCFETFPFPKPQDPTPVATAGEALYTARSAYMLAHQVGMTETWNRLTDPHHDLYDDPDITHLRHLRHTMDRAVLDAYTWTDLAPEDEAAIIARLRQLNTQRADA